MNTSRGIGTSGVMLLCLVMLLTPLTLRSQPAKALSDQLSKEADVIVVGKVGRLVSEWNEDKSRIQTRITIAVSDIIKGEAGGSSITVVVPGGEVDGVGEWYSHMPRFENDEEVVVFAAKDSKGNLKVASGQQGKFTIKKDKETGARMLPNVGSLQEFTSHIKNYLKASGKSPEHN